MTSCGRASRESRMTASRSRRADSRERGTTTSRHPPSTSFSTTWEPRKPAPPVTTTRRPDQKLSDTRYPRARACRLPGSPVPIDEVHLGLAVLAGKDPIRTKSRQEIRRGRLEVGEDPDPADFQT